ncbi:hypothetical protein [Synechococcus sp. MIT S9451]|uniref:hypothetical protein n=1 Tax=Synechococcus sp. MIT S9451 TaxID=3082543 RepID=UPI0039B45F08
MTSLKDLTCATTTVALGITLISGGGPAAQAQSAAELQLQQNQQEINRLKQQMQMQQGGGPGPQGVQPGRPQPGAAVIDARSIQRSVNLARNAAVKMNGGLSKYRPARCMFKGSERNPCIVQLNAQGIVFQIPGGPPGWEEAGQPPSLMTVLLVSPDGRSLLQTISNGALQAQPQQQPGMYPPQQQPGMYPPQQQPGMYPPQQQPGLYPPQQQPGMYPPQQQPGMYPPQQQPGMYPPQQQPGMYPPQQRPAI